MLLIVGFSFSNELNEENFNMKNFLTNEEINLVKNEIKKEKYLSLKKENVIKALNNLLNKTNNSESKIKIENKIKISKRELYDIKNKLLDITHDLRIKIFERITEKYLLMYKGKDNKLSKIIKQTEYECKPFMGKFVCNINYDFYEKVDKLSSMNQIIISEMMSDEISNIMEKSNNNIDINGEWDSLADVRDNADFYYHLDLKNFKQLFDTN